jgi:2-polyprenyl-3-methyl-5-hydroxy-6-metoxy-1,4-benzoquinol methylase
VNPNSDVFKFIADSKECEGFQMTEAQAILETSNYRKHTHSNPIQRRLIDRFHRTIVGKIGELAPRTFLDAGCGEGFVAEILLRQIPGLELTGLDFNPESVELARQMNPGATFIEASIFDIPIESDRFDLVGCFEVLEHQTDPRAALNELVRVSNQHVIVSVPREPYFSLANAARGKNLDVRPRGSDPDHKQFWTQKEFGDFVSQEMEVVWLGGSTPWTICIGRKP